jgi:ABC-type bacteriocin/lantibiotic exporter with double-glycine peptidase domain
MANERDEAPITEVELLAAARQELAAALWEVSRLCRGSADLSEEAVDQVVARQFREGQEVLEAAREAARYLGLTATPMSITAKSLRRVVQPLRPALVVTDLGARPLVVIEAREQSVTFLRGAHAEPERVSWKKFTRVLGASLSDNLNVVLFDAATATPHLAGAPGAPPPPLRRLLEFVRPDRQDIAVIAVYAVGVGLLSLATPIAVQSLVNTVAFGTVLAPLIVVLILLAAVLVFSGVLTALEFWVVEILQRRWFVRFASDLAWRLSRVDLGRWDRSRGPELVNRFFDVFSAQKAGAELLLDALAGVLGIVVGLVLLATYHPLLLVFDALLILAVVGVLFLLGRRATRTAIATSKAKYKTVQWLQEMARDPAELKSVAGNQTAQQHLNGLARGYLVHRQSHFAIVYRQIVAFLMMQVLANVALLGIGGYLVIQERLSLGQLVAAELVVTSIVASLAKGGKHLQTWYSLLASVDKIGQLTDIPLELPPGAPRTETTSKGDSGEKQ